MNFNIESVQKLLCKGMCADVQLIERKGRVLLQTPFSFPDGDPYQLYLEEQDGGLIKLTDAGHTMMHMSYENDTDAFRSGTRGKLFEQTLAGGSAQEVEGEIFIETELDNLVQSVFRLSQTINGIHNLTFLNRSRVESTFYEDLDTLLATIVDRPKIQRDYIFSNMENAQDYPIDFRIEGKVDPLFVFGILGKDKARLATIVLERLLRAEAKFESVMVFADQSSIPRGDLARLSNVSGEMVASLDARGDLRRKIDRRAA